MVTRDCACLSEIADVIGVFMILSGKNFSTYNKGYKDLATQRLSLYFSCLKLNTAQWLVYTVQKKQTQTDAACYHKIHKPFNK